MRALLIVTVVAGWWYASWLAGPHPASMVQDVIAPAGAVPAAVEPAAPSSPPEEARMGAPASAGPRARDPEAEAATAAAAAELRERSLAVPVKGVAPESLVQSFTDARGERTHEALDILAPRGTPVVAVEDGIVARLFTSDLGGLTLYQFDPSGRFCYYYAHLDAYGEGVREGQPVSRGQVIGYVGSTGNADPSAPHLHFAIFEMGPEREWWKGTPLDPFRVWR